MEPDRYQQNKVYYVIGMIFLVLSLFYLGVGLYVLPYLIFGVYYSIPPTIFDRINYVQMTYDLTEKQASWLIVCIIFFVGFMCALVTYFTSNQIDNEIFGVSPKPVEVKKEKKESGSLMLKIILIVSFVFIVTKLFQWAISSS